MASLAQVLFDFSFERLQSIATMWGIDVPTSNSPRALASFLYLEMSSTWHLRRIYESLSTEEQQILHLLIDRKDGSLSVDNLSRSMRIDQPSLRLLISNLRKFSLIHLRKLTTPRRQSAEISQGEPQASGPTEKWAIALYVELQSALRTIVRLMSSPIPSSPRLRAHLLRVDITALQSIARAWGIERPHEMDRNDLVALLMEFMANRQQIGLLVSKCSHGAQNCFLRVTERGDAIPLSGDAFGPDTPDLRKSIEELIVNMLVFEVYEDGAWYLWSVEKLFSPRAQEKESGVESSVHLEEKPVAISNRETFFGWAVLAITSYFQRKRVLIRPGNNFLPQEALIEIAEMLGIPAPNRKDGELEFVLQFVRAKGLIEKQGDIITLSSGFPSWERMDSASQTGAAIDLWANDRAWLVSPEI